MTNYDKLINTLKEVFMLDKAELDFGIYRIMNQKRKDIEQFLEVDLVPQVQKVLSDSLSVDKQALQKELDDAIKSALDLGANPDTLPKVQDIKRRLGVAADMVGIENEVFSLLANFFKRYFDNGDFISMRRYKKDVYAIPYEGEEVKLHWANADQYYIKTSEYFKVYRFKLANGRTVAFELIEASTEQNNNKSQGDKERRFAIYNEKVCETVSDEFKIYFTYEPADKKVKQSDLLELAFDAVKSQIPQEFTDLLSLRPTEKDKQRTLLQKHLLDYTARNTFDYFIHKDLGGFLTRELDFYIKNEVLFIDDLNTRDEQEFLKQLSKIKAIKKIGEKIIAFLAQLENFQKKLWLKKKMVVECNYCITLDHVQKDLYHEILNNQAQIKEWIKLFAIDEIKAQEAGSLFPENKVGFSNPLTLEFLNQNQFLVLDTAFFTETFKWKLIGSIEKFDEQCDGLLINSENFQAISLLRGRYFGKLAQVYIDPPFNTGSDFAYKDNFQTSSWMSLMYDRLLFSKDLLSVHGSFYLHLDYNANYLGRVLLNSVFGEDNFLNEITWQRSTSVGSSKAIAKRFPTLSDTIYLYTKDITQFNFNKLYTPASEEYKARFKDKDENGYYYWNTLAGFSDETYSKLEAENKVRWTEGAKYPQYKTYLHELKGNVVPDVWTDINMLNPMASERAILDFSTQKPEELIKRILLSSSNEGQIVLDYFNGSGTTSASALKMNRKFIGVEMAEYFYSKILPRIKRVLNGETIGISKDCNWKGGGIVKYMRLESYEDTLNNLALKQTVTQQSALEMNSTFKEGYMLNYMLDVEAKDSLLNLEWFVNPFNCYLNITKNNELQPTKVDLVETFNYLIGLVVESYATPKEGYVVVTGKNLAGESILVVWRDCIQHSSTSLNLFLEKSKYNPLDSEYDRIYVNGDNNVENLKTGDERWKVVLIEEEFGKKMFENI
jgi:adenine-specific DNA-methyltransferase